MTTNVAPSYCAECKGEIPATEACITLAVSKEVIHISCDPIMKRVYKVELNGPGNGLMCDSVKGIMNEIEMLVEEGAKGDQITVTVEEMRAGQLHNLPEHGGW